MQCQKTQALDAFFHQILSETQYQKLAVIGAGCSPATEATAEISHQFNITQVRLASYLTLNRSSLEKVATYDIKFSSALLCVCLSSVVRQEEV